MSFWPRLIILLFENFIFTIEWGKVAQRFLNLNELFVRGNNNVAMNNQHLPALKTISLTKSLPST